MSHRQKLRRRRGWTPAGGSDSGHIHMNGPGPFGQSEPRTEGQRSTQGAPPAARSRVRPTVVTPQSQLLSVPATGREGRRNGSPSRRRSPKRDGSSPASSSKDVDSRSIGRPRSRLSSLSADASCPSPTHPEPPHHEVMYPANLIIRRENRLPKHRFIEEELDHEMATGAVLRLFIGVYGISPYDGSFA